ncbi:hypothetical protein QYG06_20660 [Xanthomonas euvesicatoria]|nr:hypothetical protein [Xanthomonas euvesicatoria]MCC8729348.1 hypothetical protein [Xanthomonas euvesicatoria pv. euvesicatoria]MCC8744007.1 hypothetical protein [Xanthomonas euvesicatoria pv. euvesicatoria]MCC8817603.1 hypothetical protein [Xanthomonas euvesicatoria pv. euvesicatoria]MDC9642095.1 hypothetical protein [Xanthomonas euvesicatoria]MDC9662434.1 hypothetical protein [Xanthomonas euvesicatoria]
MSTTGTAFAQTQAPDARLTRVANLAGQHKPAGVPQDYVQTPFGYFAPACVRHIGASERILADGTLQKANGIQEQSARCSQDNFTSNGVRVRPNGLGLDGQEVRRGASSAAFKKRSPVPAAIDHAYISSAGYYSGVARTHRGELESAAEPNQRGEADDLLLSGIAKRYACHSATGTGLPRRKQQLGPEQLELLQGGRGLV